MTIHNLLIIKQLTLFPVSPVAQRNTFDFLYDAKDYCTAGLKSITVINVLLPATNSF